MAAPNSAPSAPPVGIRAQERFLPGAKPRDLWGSLKRLPPPRIPGSWPNGLCNIENPKAQVWSHC